MEDITKDVKSTLKERFKSTFWGPFIFSWIGWNWEIIYYLFWINQSKSGIYEINKFVNQNSSIPKLIIFPILSAITVVIVGNFFSFFSFYVNIFFEKLKVNQKILLAQKEFKLKRVENSGLTDDIEKELENLRDEISLLRNTYFTLNKEKI